jgi:hypothetical protein
LFGNLAHAVFREVLSSPAKPDDLTIFEGDMLSGLTGVLLISFWMFDELFFSGAAVSTAGDWHPVSVLNGMVIANPVRLLFRVKILNRCAPFRKDIRCVARCCHR